MKELLERIKELRIQKGLSQSEIASHLGIKQSNYGKLERGENQFTIDKLYVLAELFQVPVFMLFYVEEVDDEFVNKEYHETLKALRETNNILNQSINTQQASIKHLIWVMKQYRIFFQQMVEYNENLKEYVEKLFETSNEVMPFEKLQTLYPEITVEEFEQGQQFVKDRLGLNMNFQKLLDPLIELESTYKELDSGEQD